MNLEKEKNKICDELEKQYGIPLGREYRHIAGDMGEGEDEDSLDGDPEAQKEYLAIYREVMERNVNQLLSWLYDPKTKSLYPNSPYRQPPKKQRKPYTACFNRRFYIAEFVIKRTYRRGSLNDWRRLSAEWNKSHPESPINPGNLRTQYNRAISDPVLMFQLTSCLASEWASEKEHILSERLRNMAKYQPFSYALAASVGLILEAQSDPIFELLNVFIRESPLYKEIEAKGGVEAFARTNSALQPTGWLVKLVEDIERKGGKS